jgi:RNA polymerase subunit RPABC4/transcription elongation factor Spt4
MKKCTNCLYDYPESSHKCPACGYENEEYQNKEEVQTTYHTETSWIKESIIKSFKHVFIGSLLYMVFIIILVSLPITLETKLNTFLISFLVFILTAIIIFVRNIILDFKLGVILRNRRTSTTTGEIVDLNWIVRPVGHHSGRILLGRIYDVYPIAEFKVNGKVYRVCSSSGFTGRIRNHDTLNQNNTKYLKADFDENNREVTIFYDPEDPTNANIGYTPKQRLVFARNNIFTIIACIIIALFMLSSLIATFKG